MKHILNFDGFLNEANTSLDGKVLTGTFETYGEMSNGSILLNIKTEKGVVRLLLQAPAGTIGFGSKNYDTFLDGVEASI